MGPLKHDSLIKGVVTSWGTSNILQLIVIPKFSWDKMLPEMLLNSDTTCILSFPLCTKERNSPSFLLGSHTGIPDIVHLMTTSLFRCHTTRTYSTISKWVHPTLQMTSKVSGTKHWVILCQLLNLSELSGTWHRFSIWGSFVEGIEWREGG